MRVSYAVAAIVLFATTGSASAGCDANQRVTGNALQTLMSGSIVCGRPGASYIGSANDRWQEEHRAGGQLWDYKRGPNDSIDPTKQVGTWSIASNEVTYAYTGGGTYVRTVHLISGNTYSFCTGNGGSEVVVATIQQGAGPCAGYP